ncbi:hypothetical protein ABPG72_018352 [Tetrahymena utriculariae]
MQKVRSKPNTLASQAKKIKPIINRITKNALIYQQISQINIEEMKQTNHNHQTFDVIKTYNIINQIENKYPVNGNFQLFDQDIIISAYQNKVTNTRFLIYSQKPAKKEYQKCLKTIKQRGQFFNQCDIIEQDTHMMIMMMHIKYTNQQTFLIKDDFFGLLQQVENILNILRQSEIENQLEKANQKQEQRLAPSAKINICYLQQFFSSNSGKIVKKQKSYLLICQFIFSQYLRTYHLSDHEELEQKQLKREVCLKLNFIDSSNTFQNIQLPNLSKLKLQSIKQVSLDAYSYQQDQYYILERIHRTQNKYQYRLQYNINSFIGQKMNNNKNQKISLIFENSSLNQSKQQSQTQKYEQQQIQIGDLIFEQIQSDLLSLNQISLLQNSIKLKYRERKIILPQTQRNRLLNLIKKQKLSQLQKHLIKIVQKQYFMVELSIQQLKCQTNNKLSQQNNNEGFQQNKNKNQTNEIQVSYEDTQLSKQNYQANYNNKKMNSNNNKQLPKNLIQNDFLTQFEDRIQRMSRKQSQIFYYFPSGYYKSNINNFSGEIRQTAQQIFEGDTNYFKILLQKQKLLGGGPNSSKDKQLCSEDVQKEIQQLQQDNFFESFLDVDYKEFEDFNDGYTKYYTNDEVNEQVLENRIRKIIQVLHDECEHIFIVKIRDKVIDLINLMISYFVIILQKKKGQSIQVLIDGIDKQLKELRDTCKQNVKVYPCLDIYQYFGFLISLNSCRLGLDITNQTKIESLGKKLLSLIKFGAAFTSIYGAINNLQYITADNIKKTIKEITQICSQIAQPSQQIAQTEMESYTSYIQGNFLKNLTAILFRKINELGEEFLDPYKLIIFYVKEINHIQNQGSEDIILFAYLQLSCLLKKEQETDKLNYFSKNLKKDEKDLIFNFIQQLQLKKFSNSLLENIKKNNNQKMDTALNQNQNLSSQQIKQRLLNLFDQNEDVEKSRLEINQWNELFLIEQNISLRNQLISNIQCQQLSSMQESLQNERNIPISFEVSANVTKIQNDSGVFEYRVQGYNEIFSIQRTPKYPQKKYVLELEIKNCSDQESFIGHKSFHQNQPIFDRQCRIIQGTEVILIGIDEENKALIVKNLNNNLSSFYKFGNIKDFIKAEDVISVEYVGDTLTAAYREISILDNKIYLTDWGWDYYMNNLHSQAILNQSILMNHGGMGIYDYSERILTHEPEWKMKRYDVSSFRRFTDAIEVCILTNYRGSQDKVFEFRNVNLIICKDDE